MTLRTGTECAKYEISQTFCRNVSHFPKPNKKSLDQDAEEEGGKGEQFEPAKIEI